MRKNSLHESAIFLDDVPRLHYFKTFSKVPDDKKILYSDLKQQKDVILLTWHNLVLRRP